ncbi:MAG TPA: aminoacyl-tRNA hydrolase [Thermoanaerobaculia bacterium]|nr:aminoacyl-tRNA hydrolase [Thermoanaerobaculia bacterium]
MAVAKTTKLIIGLGNPGPEYERTRHNVGFRVADRFAEKYRIRLEGHQKDARIGRGRVAGQSVLLAKPLTYMNRSGASVAALARSFAETLGDLIVVYDDIDLPLGKIRIRESGSSGTHNGMRSIIEELATTQFPRLRFGIRGPSHPEARDLSDYVLEPFEAEEEPIVENAIPTALDALLLFVRGDLKRAMSQFNREPAPASPEESA